MYRSLLTLLLLLVVLAACNPALDPPEADASAIEAAVELSLASVNPFDHRTLFTYDRTLSLDILESSTWYERGSIWIDFTYESPLGGQVPARLGMPSGEGPYPGILLMHGSGGDIEIFTPEARKYVQLGAAVLLIESPHIRPGGRESSSVVSYIWPHMTEQDRQDQIQLIIDLQRAVDFLVEHPKVNADRLAYIGFSYGGAMGGLLAGIETRIKAYVLVVGDGGLVEHLSDPLESGLPGYYNTTWVESMWPIEPLHYVGQAKPAALLFQNGLQDELVSTTDALRYQIAGSEPKTILWYDAGHNLEPQAFQDAARWLQKYLGDDLLWMTPDYRASARFFDWGFSVWLIATVITIVKLFLSLRKANASLILTSLWLLLGIALGPVSLTFFSLDPTVNSEGLKYTKFGGRWKTSLLYAVIGSVVFLCGSLVGNLLSALFFNGDLTVLTYVCALALGWIILRVSREELSIRPFIWLLSVNILWAINVLVSYPLMRFWHLTQLLHPRLLWYVGSLTLFNIVFLFAFYHTLLAKGYMLPGDKERNGPGEIQPRTITWRLGLGLLLLSYLLVIVAILQAIANLSGLSLIELVKHLVGGYP